MKVLVKPFGAIRQILDGKREVQYVLDKDTTISDLILRIASDTKKVKDYVCKDKDCTHLNDKIIILVNGVSIGFKELDKIKLKDGDVVSLMPFVSGG